MLLVDLVAAQHSYQELLKQSLQEQKIHLQLLSQSFAASSIGVGAAATRSSFAAGGEAVNMGEAVTSTSEGASGNKVTFSTRYTFYFALLYRTFRDRRLPQLSVIVIRTEKVNCKVGSLLKN